MKKAFYRIVSLLGVTGLIFLANACLKDDRFVDFSKVSTIIELLDAVPGGIVQSPLVASVLPDTIWVRVNETGQFALNTDLTVTLAKGTVADLAVYNADTTHALGVLLPDSTLTFLGSTLVIKAGQRAGSFPILVHSEKVDLKVNWVLPIKITDAQGHTISGNLGLILFHVTVKNIYDALYHRTGTLVRQLGPGSYVNLPIDEAKVPYDALATIDAVTSSSYASFFGNPALSFHVIVNGDNTVTISPDPNAGASITNTGGKTSTYDPVTKKFSVFYGYINGAGNSRVFSEVWTPQ